MAQTLQALQQTQGATLNAEGRPITFGNDDAALKAAHQGVALCDRSHWGVLQLTGDDRLRFIHNQTTNHFAQRQPGEGCDTVFVTSTARTIDLTTVYVTEESLLILTSPGQDQRLMAWMDRYIFPADQVSLTNLTGEIAIFSLLGPDSQTLVQHLGANLNLNDTYGQHQVVDFDGSSIRVALGSGLALAGYTLLVPASEASQVWQKLVTLAALPAGEQVWQYLRVQQGRPTPQAELTDDYNPLEAGLWQTISFDKGCYIGQETIARLNTYQGVKQQLWGIQLNHTVEAGSPILVDGAKVGLVTSVVATPLGALALGYIRTKAGGAGLTVTVGSTEGVVVDVPFLSRGYLGQSGAPPTP
jgi:tRNA-modifying protein YgfZ